MAASPGGHGRRHRAAGPARAPGGAYYDEDLPVEDVTDCMIDGFLNFVADYGPMFQASEMTIFNQPLGVAGTLDIIAILPGLAIGRAGRLIPGAGVHLLRRREDRPHPEGTWQEQLAAYRRMTECLLPMGEMHPMPATDCGAVLHLRPEYQRRLPADAGLRRRRRGRVEPVPPCRGDLPGPAEGEGQARQGLLPAARGRHHARPPPVRPGRRRLRPGPVPARKAGHRRTWSTSPRWTTGDLLAVKGVGGEADRDHPRDARRPRPAPRRRGPRDSEGGVTWQSWTSSGAASRSAASASASRCRQQGRQGSGKTRPARLDTFRFTTASRVTAEAIAELYGGEVRDWEGEFEVITGKSEIGVTVPPRDEVISQWYEMWNKGGCQRRCDSQHEQISDGPCLCPHAGDPDDADEVAARRWSAPTWPRLNPPRACKLVTRITVMIPDLPGLGVFRLDTGSYYAATEIGDSAALMQFARDQGVFLPAILRIEHRQRVADGQTKKFPVPVLEVLTTFRDLATGAIERAGMAAQLPPAPGRAAPRHHGRRRAA